MSRKKKFLQEVEFARQDQQFVAAVVIFIDHKNRIRTDLNLRGVKSVEQLKETLGRIGLAAHKLAMGEGKYKIKSKR